MNEKYDRYSIVIQWDEEDHIYVVTVPELPGCMTHGITYEEALQHGREVIELWIDANEEWGKPIPAPKMLKTA
jgi:predicted RNase H-like HicB family nuclease